MPIRRQALKQGDPAQRLAFCNRFVSIVERNPGFLDELVVSDKAIFSLNLEVNPHNVIEYPQDGNGHPHGHYLELCKVPNK